MTTILFHINYLLAGGIEKVLIELLRSLHPQKYRIQLSIGYNLQELEVLKPQIPGYVEIHYLLDNPALTTRKKKKLQKKLGLGGKLIEEIILPPFKKAAMKKRLTELVKEADVIIDYDMTLAGFHSVIKGKKNAAYCHFSFRHYWRGKKSKLDKLAARLNKYDKVVMLSDEMKEDAVLMYPSLKDKIVRIYNAVDQQKIIAAGTEEVSEIENFASGFIASAGRLDESQKDFTTLIKGYGQCVREHGTKEKLVIIGDGVDREKLEQLAKDEGIEAHVFFAGFQTNPYKWMSKAKAFLFCTKFEGLPTVLIEAHSLRKPIIATASPTGIKELLMQGQAGTLITPGNAAELSDALYQLLTSQQLQDDYLRHAATILREFEVSETVKKFEDLLIRN